jgi:hypothetical protein
VIISAGIALNKSRPFGFAGQQIIILFSDPLIPQGGLLNLFLFLVPLVILQNFGNNFWVVLLIFTPFHFPPRGKGFDAPSPLGEGWEGGNLPIKSNKFYRLIICYHYCEELHG